MGAAQSGLFYARAPLAPKRASSTSSRGMGILPMRNNPARHGQDAHATEYCRRSIFLKCPGIASSVCLLIFYCTKSQTLRASPAEPGDLLLDFSMTEANQDQHNVEIHENRLAWEKKKTLRMAYARLYAEIAAHLERFNPNSVFESRSPIAARLIS